MTSANKIQIFIVDDQPANLKVLSDFLTISGFEVLVAKDGERALKKLQKVSPDLILLDVMMPGLDGFETCSRLQASEVTREIPIIFMTALSETPDRVKGLHLGAVDYITKPFQQEEVLARINIHLRLRAYAKQLQVQNQLLQQAKEAAEVANKAKSRFLATMSHELRTPLNAILGFAQLMEHDENTPEKHQKYLKIINQSGDHLLNLINDVLQVSKIESGQVTAKNKNFNLYRFLHNLDALLQLKAQEKGLQLVLDCAEEVPQYICADNDKLRQVLINLLDNAIKFTRQGQVILRVKPWAMDSATDQWLAFEIEDTGSGIAAADIEGLFQPFVQTSSDYQTEQGVGLGLPISHQFIALMGGKIAIQSQLNQGTTVRVTIPIQRGERDIDPPKLSLQRPTQMAGVAEQPTYRILVVEDDPTSRNLLLDLLRPLGFEIQAVENGQMAVERWRSWQPHLILMDLQMPILDGYQATRLIRVEGGPVTDAPSSDTFDRVETKIIALTAKAFEHDRHAALASGCNDFLSKPVHNAVLLSKIAEQLGIPDHAVNSQRFLRDNHLHSSGEGPLSAQPLSNPILQAADLAVMSQPWCRQLQMAASLADTDRILALIEEIPNEHSNLAAALRELVNRFQFEQVMALVREPDQH